MGKNNGVTGVKARHGQRSISDFYETKKNSRDVVKLVYASGHSNREWGDWDNRKGLRKFPGSNVNGTNTTNTMGAWEHYPSI